MKTYKPRTLKQLEENPTSKGKVFEDATFTFDNALPQPWVDSFVKFCKKYRPKVTYHLIVSSTVFAYDEKYQGSMTCCAEVFEAWKSWRDYPGE